MSTTLPRKPTGINLIRRRVHVKSGRHRNAKCPSIHSNYWHADDGRVYFSGTQVQMTTNDPDYVAWVDAGNTATQWPRDDQGAQTDAALQEVLDPYNKFANLKYYTAFKRWQKEQGGITLESGMPIKTDDRSQAKISGAYFAGTGAADRRHAMGPLRTATSTRSMARRSPP